MMVLDAANVLEHARKQPKTRYFICFLSVGVTVPMCHNVTYTVTIGKRKNHGTVTSNRKLPILADMRGTREDAAKVIEAIVEGHSLKDALLSVGIGKTTFYRLVETHFDLQNSLARAEKIRADTIADEILHIADTQDNPLKARNQIDARKWLASVYNRTKYGEQIDLSVTNRVNLIDVIAEARKRAVPGWFQENATDAQLVETPQLEAPIPVGAAPTNVDSEETDDALTDASSLLD
jgi:hypothetical protein